MILISFEYYFIWLKRSDLQWSDDHLNSVFKLFNLDSYFFEIPYSQINSVGLLNSLIGNVLNGNTLDSTVSHLIRATEYHERHKGISTVVEIKFDYFLIGF